MTPAEPVDLERLQREYKAEGCLILYSEEAAAVLAELTEGRDALNKALLVGLSL